jgi:gamma-glutamylcysteine synthetase
VGLAKKGDNSYKVWCCSHIVFFFFGLLRNLQFLMTCTETWQEWECDERNSFRCSHKASRCR